ncbi:MAG: hypothetical protein FWC33_05565 [Candidatus Bathyarchaeota archaeon]|nr:hypothetical protein [Candidatus Termiticorpusculum sp.]
MSVKDKIFSGNNPVSVTVGGVTYSGVMVFAHRAGAVGGGDVAEHRTVPGYSGPQGFTHKHKERVIIVTIDSWELQDNLENGGYWHDGDDNKVLPFEVKQKRGDGKTRTVKFDTENTLLVRMESNLENLAKQQGTELTILTSGKPTKTPWA